MSEKRYLEDDDIVTSVTTDLSEATEDADSRDADATDVTDTEDADSTDADATDVTDADDADSTDAGDSTDASDA